MENLNPFLFRNKLNQGLHYSAQIQIFFQFFQIQMAHPPIVSGPREAAKDSSYGACLNVQKEMNFIVLISEGRISANSFSTSYETLMLCSGKTLERWGAWEGEQL